MGEFRKLAWFGLGALMLALTGMVLAVGLVQPAHAQSLAPAATATGTLVIHVRNVAPRGLVRLGLYDAASYPHDEAAPAASADVAAQMGVTTITLHNIAPGTYAVQAYQDLNANDKMDTSWLGLPQEPYGFSRDARPVLSKPGFDRVRFEVQPGMNVHTLHLQNAQSVVAERMRDNSSN